MNNPEPKNLENKIVIGLVGRICAGKGEISAHMAEKYGAAVLSFSEPMRDILRILHQDISRANIQTLSLAMRQHFGESVFSTMIKGQAIERPEHIIVLDPFRRPADIAAFSGDSLITIGVKRDFQARYQSMIDRNREKSDSNISREKFNELDNAESEKDIDNMVEKTDYLVENNGTLGELRAKVDEIMTRIMKNKN